MTDVASTRAAVAAEATDPAPRARRTFAWLASFFALGLTIALAVQLFAFAPEDKSLGATMAQQLLNAHALLLVFFCALPALTHVFGQAILPAAVGRSDHAFPMLGSWGFRLYVLGGLAVAVAVALGSLPTDWSLVAATSTAHGVIGALLALGLHLVALSMLAVALNHLATIFAGERDADAPTSVLAWTFGVAALVVLAVAPAIASWSVLFFVEGSGTALFGIEGDHTLATFARLFGFVEFGAGLLVMVVGIGLAMQVLATVASRPLDLGSRVGPALGALALLGLFAGAFPMGQGADVAIVSSALRFALVIPAAVLLHALWEIARHGVARVDAAVLHTLGFVLHAIVVAASGLALASLATGPVLEGTKFQAAHQHMIFAGCGLAIFFAASHRWWPALFGNELDERLGLWGATFVFAGTQIAFLPGLILGGRGLLSGTTALPQDGADLGALGAIGAFVLAVGVLFEGWAMLRALQTFLAKRGSDAA